MKKTNNRGFSLVELILAIAILAIIMEKGQEIFDSISDKLMQATCVKIGTSDGNVYYSYPSEGKYEFSGIDGVDKETDISYICIAYELSLIHI